MTARKGQGFPKAARIRRRREFLSLGRTWERQRTENFVFLTKHCVATPRLGITVSRKVGGAVARTLLKRRVREVFRRHADRSRFGHDLIVIAKVGASALTIRAVQREFTAALSRQSVSPGPRQT